MSKADEIYNEVTKKIIEDGYSDENTNVRTVYADGTPAYTKSIFGIQVEFDGKEVPILTSKKVYSQTAIKEMLLFWVRQSVKEKDFKEWNVKVWDEWFLSDGTLGRSYAYQFESRPKKEIVKVKKLRKGIHGDLPLINVGEKAFPNTNNESKYVGNTYSTKDYGDYTVLDVYYKNPTDSTRKALVQFVQTNYIKEIDITQVIKSQNVTDPYYRYYFNVGYLGNHKSVKNYTEEELDKLYRKWYYMLKRCYDKNDRQYHMYGDKGVFVDERWHCFENYLRDIRYIPQFFLAKEDNFKGWSIDKDYYDANFYGKESACWLKDGENLIIRNTNQQPFYLIKPNGDKELYLTLADAEKDYSLTNLNKVYNGVRKHVRNFTIEPIEYDHSCDFLYRYKLSKNQVVELLQSIKNTPSSRRHMTSFWNFKDVEDKALQECAFQTQWNTYNKTLDLLLTQRSADWGLGAPFNQFQYYVLQNMIANVLNLKVGKFIHHIGSCHIYDRHEKELKEQMNKDTYDAPTLWVNPEVKDFFDYTPDDIKLINYKCNNPIQMEVAI
ncbi:thymidylate synthase [Priestia aryabhattai]|uniref:thymidylate synthase n=1 Tax=Priestia aryabhattai TaxID=412384 RepID=UPI0015F5D913|nr:thymidylate synthase [Priestia aryabhattai]